MPSLLSRALRRVAADRSSSVFLATVLMTLFRARDLPSVELGVARTGVSVGPADAALLLTGVLALARLRSQRRLPAPALVGAAAAFACLILVTSLANGATAFVAASKLVELGVLALGAAAFVDTRERLGALLAVVVSFAAVATAWAAAAFVGAGGGRQPSFIGEHDLAAISTLALGVGLARMHGRRESPGALAVVAIAVGIVGVVLGASLASLLGLYLMAAALFAVSLRRGELRVAAALVTIAAVGVASAGTLALRQGDLGFLQSWFGPAPSQPGEYASSWSQRLIYAYVGGRVFLDRPLLGTGWQGELPPPDFARYVPDARERFPDQPRHYFPPTDEGFIPQQTYDQVLFQLGLVGAGLFAALAVAAGRQAARAVRWRSPDAAYVPAAWLGAMTGALAGAALFGGSPIAAAFWLTLGVAAAQSREVGRA